MRDPGARAWVKVVTRFAHAPLENMVAPGLTTAWSARIWGRSAGSGPHSIALRGENDAEERSRSIAIAGNSADDGTFAVELGPEDGLRPGKKYAFRVERDGELVGEGRFETAPEGVDDAPETFSFAVGSCHLPFGSNGKLHDPALRMLRVAEQALEEREVKRVLFVGDQMYADMPTGLSLFEDEHFRAVAPVGCTSIRECSTAQIRALYQERYRIFWNIDPLRHIYARWPCLPMLDDHEIVDNWGSAPFHLDPAWQRILAGAREAYRDYQDLRIHDRVPALPLPRSFDYGFDYGPVSCFVMDLRSERVATRAVCKPYSERQLDDLRRFLATRAEQPVVLIVLTVPMLNVPHFILRGVERILGGENTDPGDRWGHTRMHEARDQLLLALRAHQREHPRQKVVLVGGDVHFGMASEIEWSDGSGRLYQLVSSPISNHQGALLENVAKVAPSLRVTFSRDGERYAVGRLLDAEGGSNNPFGNLNLGFVTIRRHGAEHSVQLELISHDDSDPPGIRRVFRTAEL